MLWEIEMSSLVDLEPPVLYSGERPSRETWLMLCLLPSTDEGDGLLGSVLVLTVGNCCAERICQSPGDLVVTPMVLSFPRGLWAATADVL